MMEEWRVPGSYLGSFSIYLSRYWLTKPFLVGGGFLLRRLRV